MSVRKATHAGVWFKGDKAALNSQLEKLLGEVSADHPEFPIPGARVVVGPYVFCNIKLEYRN